MASEAGGRRDIYLFDSFEGLPPPGAEDGALARQQFQPGWCASTEDDVRRAFDLAGASTARLHIVKGWFADTFPRTGLPPIALLHIDADWYDSVRLCLETWYDRITPGGYVVLDDYGRWEGCTRAADEFLRERRLPPLARTGSAGHYLRKPARPAAQRPGCARRDGILAADLTPIGPHLWPASPGSLSGGVGATERHG
jgi:hypothetical protein